MMITGKKKEKETGNRRALVTLYVIPGINAVELYDPQVQIAASYRSMD